MLHWQVDGAFGAGDGHVFVVLNRSFFKCLIDLIDADEMVLALVGDQFLQLLLAGATMSLRKVSR